MLALTAVVTVTAVVIVGIVVAVFFVVTGIVASRFSRSAAVSLEFVLSVGRTYLSHSSSLAFYFILSCAKVRGVIWSDFPEGTGHIVYTQ